MKRVPLAIIFSAIFCCATWSTAFADILEIRNVKTFGELKRAPAVNLASGWIVNLGLSDIGQEPWMLIYCLAEHDRKGDRTSCPSIPLESKGLLLGPVSYNIVHEDHHEEASISRIIPKINKGLKRTVRAASRGKVLFVGVVPVPKKGNYLFEVFDHDGTVVGRKEIVVKNARPSYWQNFIHLLWKVVEPDEQPWAVARYPFGVYPWLDGKNYLHGETLRKAISKDILPGKIDTRADCVRDVNLEGFSLKLSIKNGQFVVESKDGMLGHELERSLLARWWVNDEPVPGGLIVFSKLPGGPSISPFGPVGLRSLERLKTRYFLRVPICLPQSLKQPKPGTTIGFQLLYCPGGSRYLRSKIPSTRAKKIFYSKELLPQLSNRVNFVITKDMLERKTDCQVSCIQTLRADPHIKP